MKHLAKNLKARLAGFTLIEVMIALGIFATVGAGIAVYMKNFIAVLYRIEAMGTRDTIAIQLRRYLTVDNIEYSAYEFADPGNTALQNCVPKPAPSTIDPSSGFPATSGCTATNSNAPVSFIFGFNQGGTPHQLSGSDSAPLYLRHDGKPCNGTCTAATAEWQVTTYFTAICPVPAGTLSALPTNSFNSTTPNARTNQWSSCPRALLIRVGFLVKNLNLHGQRLLPSAPPTITSATATNQTFITVPIYRAPTASNNSCNPFSYISAVDNLGNVTCRCVDGANQTGLVNGQPACQLTVPTTQQCSTSATREYLSGVTAQYTASCQPAALYNMWDAFPTGHCNWLSEGTSWQQCYNMTGYVGGIQIGQWYLAVGWYPVTNCYQCNCDACGNCQTCCTTTYVYYSDWVYSGNMEYCCWAP